MPLINCGIVIDLRRQRNCVITEISRPFRAVDLNADPVLHELVTETTGATFQINNLKLYVSVITLSCSNSIKFL